MANLTIASFVPAAAAMIGAWPDSLADVDAALERSLEGGEVPTIGTHASSTKGTIACLSPGRYLILSDEPEWVGSITASLSIDKAACVILDHSRQAYRLRGNRAADVLMKGIAVDMDEAVTSPGSVIQSSIHGVGVIALRHTSDIFDLYVYVSLADSFADWLKDAALEYGFREAAGAALLV